MCILSSLKDHHGFLVVDRNPKQEKRSSRFGWACPGLLMDARMYNCPLEQLLDYLMKLLVLTTAQNETLDIPKQLDSKPVTRI